MDSFRIRRKNLNFVMPTNPIQEDRSITLQAKGLLTLFLSFPEEWEYRMSDIVNRSKNGRDSTRRALNELLSAGYVAREYARDPTSGRIIGSQYIVSDEPSFPVLPKD